MDADHWSSRRPSQPWPDTEPDVQQVLAAIAASITLLTVVPPAWELLVPQQAPQTAPATALKVASYWDAFAAQREPSITLPAYLQVRVGLCGWGWPLADRDGGAGSGSGSMPTQASRALSEC